MQKELRDKFKKWMIDNIHSYREMGALIGVSPQAVKRFVDGCDSHTTTVAYIERFLRDK